MHHGGTTTSTPSVTSALSYESECLKEEGLERDEEWEVKQERKVWKREERLRRKQRVGLKR